MYRLEHLVQNPLGLHVRPAGQLAKQARQYSAAITARANGKKADAKKLFSLVALGASKGQMLYLEIEGTDEGEAAQALTETLAALL